MHNVQSGRRGPLEVSRPLLWLGATAAITLFLDQLTKVAIRASLGLNEAVPVIPGFFDIAHVENTGAAFGMLPGRRELFIGISLLMLLAVAVYWWRMRPTAWPVVIALGLVVGGALGNLIDRAFVGKVTDFLAFTLFSPVFNIADSGIVVGTSVLVIWILFGPDESATAQASTTQDSDDPHVEVGGDPIGDAQR